MSSVSLWHTAPKTKLAHVTVNQSPALSVAVFCFSPPSCRPTSGTKCSKRFAADHASEHDAVSVSQWWSGIFVPAKGSVNCLHPDTEFKRTSEFQYGNSPQLSFSMGQIYRHLSESKKGKPLSQGSHKAVGIDSHWSPLSLLHYTPILQNHRIWGMGRNKSMLCSHCQRVPEVLLKVTLTSWAVVCWRVRLGSHLFLGK